MPLSIAFFDSWHGERQQGSGTTAAIDGLADGLTELGHRVTRLRPTTRRTTLISRLRYNLELPHRVAEGRYDLLVGFDWDGFAVCPRRGQRYVVALKGVSADEARFEHGFSHLSLRLQGALERLNARHAQRVLTPSLYSARATCRAYGLPPAQVAVVPEGVTLPTSANREANTAVGRADADTAVGRADADEILCVARQYPRKNTAALLAALPRVRRAVPEARLRVVGGGPELPRLRARAHALSLEGVTFTGEVPDAAVREAYRRAAVFCLPSLQEGYGIVFLEAMAAGLPVVAGNAGAAPEVIANGTTGLLVPPTDPERLAGALIRLLTRPRLRARMGRAARRQAEAHSWPLVASLFLQRAGVAPDPV